MAGFESVVFAVVAAGAASVAALTATIRAWMIGRSRDRVSEFNLRITKENGEVIELHGESLRPGDLDRILKILADDLPNSSSAQIIESDTEGGDEPA